MFKFLTHFGLYVSESQIKRVQSIYTQDINTQIRINKNKKLEAIKPDIIPPELPIVNDNNMDEILIYLIWMKRTIKLIGIMIGIY